GAALGLTARQRSRNASGRDLNRRNSEAFKRSRYSVPGNNWRRRVLFPVCRGPHKNNDCRDAISSLISRLYMYKRLNTLDFYRQYEARLLSGKFHLRSANMKTAAFYGPQQPLTIEEGTLRNRLSSGDWGYLVRSTQSPSQRLDCCRAPASRHP